MKHQEPVEDETRYAELELEPETAAPEERALHVVEEPGVARIVDPELAIIAADPDGPPEHHFPDEEFEGQAPEGWDRDTDELDLEEVLERQHYAFPEEHGGGERD